jgi:LmbE family N-acetylglucosaminyl deacetylase
MNLFIIGVGIVLVLWGLANVFYGYRFYRVTILVVFAIIGASFSFISLRESPNLVQILVPGLVAFLFGLAAYYLRSAILILAGGVILAIVATLPALVFSLPETFGWILAIMGLILGMGLAYFFRQHTIYLVTAMWGASYAFSGITIIFLGRTFGTLRALGSGFWLGLAAWLVLVAIGVYWQHRAQTQISGSEELSTANMLRFWQASLLALLVGVGVTGILGVLRTNSPFVTLNPPKLDDFEVLSLDGYDRLLVLAPHNDDEALGAAGLIMQAVEQGIEVHVVFMTNGDGFTFSTITEFETLFPAAEDYIALGDLRQQESINVLGMLGVPEENITFLGYPDAGAPSMWYENWSVENPHQSQFTETSKSPYVNTYNPDSVYAGEDLLGDIRSILEEIQPDIVAYPHGNDVHADHWGMYVFSRLALEINQFLDSNFNPDTFVYLVHRPDYPFPEGYDPQELLLPPAPVYNIYPTWYRLDLTQDQVELKEKALEEYKSQIDLLWALMSKFIRKNEVFTTHTTIPIPELAAGDPSNPHTWLDSDGQKIIAVQLDPAADILERALIPSADLKALYLARLSSDEIIACAEAADGPEPDVFYVLHVKGIGFEGVIHHVQDAEPTLSSDLAFLDRRYYACSSFSLDKLGNPVFIFAGAETEDLSSDMPIDHIAWQMVEIPQNP